MTLSRIRHISLLFELIAVLLIALFYFSHIKPPPQLATAVDDHIDLTPLENTLLDPLIRQSGLEHERLTGVLLPVKIGLDNYGRIPTWNPYMTTGEPIINNAFNYLFNPFHSLPILLLGGVQGSKLATFIALLIAGYSMWSFACALGLGALARITTAALYMMSGGIVAKFYAGHFQLALSLAWPPLVFAALWWTLHSHTRLAPVSFGIAFVLLFFAGNIYYVLHTLLCVVIITAFHLIERSQAPENAISSALPLATQWRGGWGERIFLPFSLILRRLGGKRWHFRADRFRRICIAFIFAFGLAALQFFPVWVTRDYVNHPAQDINTDGSLAGSYDLGQAVTNLTYPWPQWQNFETPDSGQLAAVDYAYIGIAPFLLILLALIASVRYKISVPRTQHSVLFLLLALIMMIWGAGQSSILGWLYAKIPLLAEFRFLGRALSIAALWWIVLAGIAIDSLWKAARESLSVPLEFIAHNRFRLIRAMLIAGLFWLYWLVYSIANPSTRQSMVFYNFRWLNTLDDHRLTTLAGAVNAFWILLLIAVLIDTLLLILERRLRPTWAQARGIGWRAFASRVIQFIILSLVVVAILDIMTVNSRLFDFQLVHPRLTSIYADIHQWDTNPFPSVNEPFSDLAFDDYENGIRTWGLTEGWRPWSPLGMIQSLNTLSDLPRWAIVSNFYSGSSQQYAQGFVDSHGYIQKKCYVLHATGSADDPCLMDDQHIAAVLYEKPDALPYAFAVPAALLLSDPARLNAFNVSPVRQISHQLDTITIQAVTPADSPPNMYYLILEETSYPGWQATVDGVATQVETVQTEFVGIHNRGFLAVQMSPGTHTYTLHFEPPGLTTGMLISAFTLLLIIGYLLYPRFRK